MSRSVTLSVIETNQQAVHNSAIGDAQAVVQAGAIRRLTIGGNHSGVIISVIAVVVAAVGVVVGLTRGDPAPGIAAVSAYEAKKDCKSGWVVPDHGETEFLRPPQGFTPSKGTVLSPGGLLTVTVQGLTGKAVVLQSATVREVRRGPAVVGAFLRSDCGGGMTPRYFHLDLDASPPTLVPDAGTTGFPYRVDEVEPEQFRVTPDITTGYVEWRLVLEWTSGDQRGELVIDDDGEPFRTTATSASRRFCTDVGQPSWRPTC